MPCGRVQSAVDALSGAGGFTDDLSTLQHIHRGLDELLHDCTTTRTSDSSTSNPHSSHGSPHSSSTDHQRNIQHNHTYPLSEAERSRDEQQQRQIEERATRSRDERAAKDMQVQILKIARHTACEHSVKKT